MGKVFYLVFGCWLSTTIGIIIYACLNSTTTTTITTTTTTTKQSAKMSNKNITGPNNNITINRNKDNLKEALLNTDAHFGNNLTSPLPPPPQNAELPEYETDENELGINEAEGGDISVDESQDEAAVTHLHNSGKDSGAANSFATTTKTTSPSTVASTAPRNGKRKKKEEVAAICVGCSPQSIAGVKKAKKANNGATTSPNETQTATAAMKHECQQCQQFQKCLKSLMKTLETFINA